MYIYMWRYKVSLTRGDVAIERVDDNRNLQLAGGSGRSSFSGRR